MKYIGVRGHSLEWFKSHLSNGTQFVYINGVLSKEASTKFEVPQGSILGQLRFLMYINDISGVTDYATARMYADDTIMTFTVRGVPVLRYSISVDLQHLH